MPALHCPPHVALHPRVPNPTPLPAKTARPRAAAEAACYRAAPSRCPCQPRTAHATRVYACADAYIRIYLCIQHTQQPTYAYTVYTVCTPVCPMHRMYTVYCILYIQYTHNTHNIYNTYNTHNAHNALIHAFCSHCTYRRSSISTVSSVCSLRHSARHRSCLGSTRPVSPSTHGKLIFDTKYTDGALSGYSSPQCIRML